jgi:hypothetical protein
VEFQFDPLSVKVGLVVTLVSLLAGAGLLLATSRRR